VDSRGNLFAARQSLVKQLPVAANIATPDTTRPPPCPRIAALRPYIDGTDGPSLKNTATIWGGILLLSGLGSGRRWSPQLSEAGRKKSKASTMRDRTLALIARARRGNSVDELQDMQHEVDGILHEILVCYDDGAIDDGDLSASAWCSSSFITPSRTGAWRWENMPQDLARLRPAIAKT